MSWRRQVYLKMTGAEEALARLMACVEELPALGEETIPTTQAAGRVTASPVYACASSPPFPAAAMDGYAVRSALTFTASEAQPISLRVPEEAEPVDTGEALPAGKDAVYKIEEVDEQPEAISVLAAAWPGQHVRLVGEEVTAGELLMTSGERITPRYVGLLLAAQVWTVLVRQKPVVTLIPTGAELAPVGQEPEPGQLVEYDGPMLAAMLSEWGAEARLLPPVADDREALAKALLQATEDSDLVGVIAGSSAGRQDFVPQVISELGELLVHGVRMMPGKPLALGRIADTPIIGLPGYSVAAWTVLERYARPLLCRLLGLPPPQRATTVARLRRKLPSRGGVREVVRVALCDVGDELTAVPLSRGSSIISSLAMAQGLVSIEEAREGWDAGSEVEVELLAPPEEIERSVLMVGSHDLALAAVAEHMAQRQPPLRLLCLSVGSAEGLAALSRGEGHLAGTHLLDLATGEYNVPYLRHWLPNLPLVLVNLAFRQVGLLVRPGNPQGITTIADLAREGVTFVNRQAGSGTRVLLDFLLQQEGISAQETTGYEREAPTHTMVCEAIRQGSADVGLGILAAARIFGLDFVPLIEERYDLVIPKALLDRPKIVALLKTLQDPAFRKAVEDLEGYSIRNTGETVYEQ